MALYNFTPLLKVLKLNEATQSYTKLCEAILFGGKFKFKVFLLSQDFDEYLATPNNYPTLKRMRAFESFSWDELNGGHVSIIKDR